MTEPIQPLDQIPAKPAKSRNLLIFLSLIFIIISLGIVEFVYKRLSNYQPFPTPSIECVEKNSLNCADEPELSYECTEEYQSWARAHCPDWQELVYCNDPRPEVCTMECIENPPYICGSNGENYCSTCQACSNKSVIWYEIKSSSCREGQFCGGIAGVECPEGYFCEYDGHYPDASGVCIRLSEHIPAISDSELSRGWYYGTEGQKKPNTPASWICTEAGRSSCWHEPSFSCPNFPPD